VCRSRELSHGLGLRPFRSLHDLELYTVALIQRAEPTAIDGRVMDEYVGAIVLGNKPIALLIIEPFNGSRKRFGRKVGAGNGGPTGPRAARHRPRPRGHPNCTRGPFGRRRHRAMARATGSA
jgi:hypothetical protein